MNLFEDPEALKKFENLRELVIAQEHSQMPKTCGKCGKFFKFPEKYAKYFETW